MSYVITYCARIRFNFSQLCGILISPSMCNILGTGWQARSYIDSEKVTVDCARIHFFFVYVPIGYVIGILRTLRTYPRLSFLDCCVAEYFFNFILFVKANYIRFCCNRLLLHYMRHNFLQLNDTRFRYSGNCIHTDEVIRDCRMSKPFFVRIR